MNLLWAFGALVLHSAAIVTWIVISDVSFEAEHVEEFSADEKV